MTWGMNNSELENLLQKNTFYPGGLNEWEINRAKELIENPEYSEKKCWACEVAGERNGEWRYNKAIYDTGLCQRHAIAALAVRETKLFNELYA
jgi:hypothetical protein